MHPSEIEGSEARTLACYLSHIAALTKVRDSPEEGLYLIMEDDVDLEPDWQRTLER